MRACVVSPVFVPSLGYQEVYVASALSKMGFDVKVISSFGTPEGIKISFNSANELGEVPFSIVRLPLRFHFRSTWIPDSGVLVQLVDRYSPDLVVVFNVRSGFPLGILRSSQLVSIPMIGFFSDAREYRRRDTVKQKIKSFLQDVGAGILHKKQWYIDALQRLDIVVCNTPETKEILLRYAQNDERIRKKMILKPLGVNLQHFYFDPKLRERMRRKFHLSEQDIVVITVTKVLPTKGIDKLLNHLRLLMIQIPELHYWIVGTLNDDYSRYLQKLVSKDSAISSRIRFFPKQLPSQLVSLLNAADIGIWYYATHAIQEAMATGLPVILPDRDSVSHLIRSPKMGIYYRDLADLKTVDIYSLGTQRLYRSSLATENQQFLDYRKILQDLISRVGL